MLRKPSIREPIVDINCQSQCCGEVCFSSLHSVPSLTTAENEQKYCRCSLLVKGGERVIATIDESVETCLDAIYNGSKLTESGECIGYSDHFMGKYVWFNYNEVIWRSKYFGSGLVNIGCKPGNQTFIGIYGVNCVEWFIAQYGCYHFSMVIVPLYDSLGINSCSFVINEANLECVIVDTQQKVHKLLNDIGQLPSLSQIISIDHDLNESVLNKAKNSGISLFTFKQIELLGKSTPQTIKPPNASDLAMIMYTSGTTGNPKGVMLTHANYIAAATGLTMQVSPHIEMKKQTMLSFLPMAHSYEQSVQTAFVMGGGRIGFFSGDIKEIVNDLKLLKPTVLVVVPRLLNRIYNKVISDVKNSVVKSYLFRQGMTRKQREIEKYLVRNNGFWDRIVFKKIRETFGGNVKLVSSGSAPLSATILNFFRCALGCFVIEGYGQTECCGPATAAFPGDYTTGHVGPPVSCSEIKLIDAPEMNYFVDQCGIGEVCIRGTNVFRGYYKNTEKTLETIDENGWLHTGDIGAWTDSGTLKIIDRKKHIFKLSQGEYIAPEKIENIYCQSPYAAQCFVDGDSLKSCVVAIVVPDIDQLNYWCAQRSINLTLEEACKNNSFRKTVFEDMINTGKREGLFSFEQVKEIHLHNEPFTLENDLLTPTMKTKRSNCRVVFKAKIDEMYCRLESNGQA